MTAVATTCQRCLLALLFGLLMTRSEGLLTLNLYNNTAFAGEPAVVKLLPAINFSVSASQPFSAELVGTLSANEGETYSFACDFGTAALAYFHADDHLLCGTGTNSPSGKVVGTDNPLPTMSRKSLPLRLAVVHDGRASAGDTITVTVSVSVLSPSPSPAPHPVTFLPTLPALEVQRRQMQQELLQGWGAFYDMSYLDQVLLPEGAKLTLGLCETKAGGSCVTEARVDWPPAGALKPTLRLGLHAVDRSYGQMFLAIPECNVSIAFGNGRGKATNDLLATVSVVEPSGTTGADNCAAHALVLIGSTAWYRVSQISAGQSQLTFDSLGMRNTTVHATEQAQDVAVPLPAQLAAKPHLVFPLTTSTSSATSSPVTIGLSTIASDTLSTIQAKLEAARAKEQASYDKYGSLAETAEAVQVAVMWNTIYCPLEYGPFTPVIRGNPWTLDGHDGNLPVNDDWAYVIFDWDNFFAAYMLSLFSKELGYSALIQVVKTKTAEGFIPNDGQGSFKELHSEPVVGSKVLLEMYQKYHDLWIVELLYDDLKDWNDWFTKERPLPPLNITCLGGENMQAARYESGLDNSPMYDGDFYTKDPTGGSNGLMLQYDVGMASMYTMDSAALATLATAINRPDDAELLQSRADAMRTRIEAHLWDEESGIYVNRRQNGTFNRRVSPTSFYAMQTTGPSSTRVDTMMHQWLTNSSRFCVSPTGDFKGNSDTCYWGLPSISADDPAFPELGYWRGYVWGPMAQLTYWGLENYKDVASAKAATQGLCRQMNAMMLDQWRLTGHICENFSPQKQATECTGMHFYHWGALAGFISLLDGGYY